MNIVRLHVQYTSLLLSFLIFHQSPCTCTCVLLGTDEQLTVNPADTTITTDGWRYMFTSIVDVNVPGTLINLGVSVYNTYCNLRFLSQVA